MANQKKVQNKKVKVDPHGQVHIRATFNNIVKDASVKYNINIL